MKHRLTHAGISALALLTALAAADVAAAADYPSCDLTAQRAIEGEIGGTVTDPRQAHISVRANVLQADIGTARKARTLSRGEARHLWKRVDKVRKDTDTFTRQQGFLSAAERASYDRELDAVAGEICK